MPVRSKKKDLLASAWMPIVETLEDRRLFSATTIQTLPFLLDFSADKGELVDKVGQGTGFTRVQANKLGTEYQPALIDLDTTAGVLKLTTTGTSTAGSNTNTDNTLVNGLETQFDATTSGFKITTRLVGPLDYINTASDQGGIEFGPDQDNWVKLVAISQNGSQYVQFFSETGASTHQQNALITVGTPFSQIQTLDLQMVGDAGAGTVTPYYSVNGGSFVKINKTFTVSGTTKAKFFNAAGRAGLIALHKNDIGPITVSFDSFRIDAGVPVAAQPQVTTSRPGNGDIGVARNAFVAADVFLPTPGAGVDATTLSSTTVHLFRTADRAMVDAVLNTSGGGDAIVLTPTTLLDPNTTYTFEVTSGLKDTAGSSFAPYTATFTTGTSGGDTNPNLAFEKIGLPTANGQTYTGVQMGPDGRLYASTIDGIIQRFNINADGTLGTPFNITSIQTAEAGPRIITGMAFDSAGNLWVSHNQYTDITLNTASDWTGKISKLSGANYATVTTAVINLPRSVRDHMTNQMAFGPDGALYFAQAANTAMGSPDNAWGLRTEHLLTAAILRLDITKVGATPIDVKTEEGGTYNPFAPGAPLTIYATGVRNAYDLVWTSDGKLFAAVNGSAAGGSTPGTPTAPYSFGANQRIDFAANGAYTGPDVPALTNVSVQNDYIYNIVKGGYYGHPNPVRGEFVMNGGNPTAGVDPNEVPQYPVGTMPDRNYRGDNTGAASDTLGSAFAYGLNYSPDGIIQYAGPAFNGALDGKLMVVDYSGGDDVSVLTRDASGNITDIQRGGIAGLLHFIDPLDIVENKSTGFLYVAEFGGQKLTLVRPIAPGGNVSADKSQLVFTDPTSSGSAAAQTITITNTGTAALAFPSDGFSITGTDAARFSITAKPTLPMSIQPGESVTVSVTFTSTTVGDIRNANLQIKSNDADSSIINIPLRGLGTSGFGGTNEPSLQQLMNLLRIPITVGDTTPLEVNLNDPPATPNDEVVMPILQKEGNGPVTIEPLATFGVGDSNIPTFRFGYYTPGNKNDTTELLKVIGVANSQTVNPIIQGGTSFDPGDSPFSLYTYWQKFTATGSPTVYSEDALNLGYDAHSPRKLRFYPLKTTDGSVVPNAYVFAWEEFNQTYDNQDFVGIIRNVMPAPSGAGPEIGFENLDGQPYSDRLVFNRIEVQPPAPENANGISGYVPPPNIVHDTAKLRIRNSGSQTLTIGSLILSDTSSFTLVNPPTTPFDIAPGASFDLTVQFIAHSGGEVLGTLTINSNDADEPAAKVQLSGWWQKINEGSPSAEPKLQQVFDVYGFATSAVNAGQLLNQGGKVARVGDEILSPYWNRVDSQLPVSIRQLNAFHTQGNTASTFWYLKGSTSTSLLFTADGDEGQSFLPHKNNATVGVTDPNYAQTTFSPSNIFGFKIDGEWSDDTKNVQEQSGGGYGHHVRFYVAKDRDGNIIPNTYLMTMDYSGINYDYNDNSFLITNLKPASPPSVPAGLAATPTGAGIALDWNDNTEANLAGYNVYRASTTGGPYTKLNADLLTTSAFTDVTAPVGSASFYVVTAVDNVGNESGNSLEVTATRMTDTTPPAAPKSLVASGTSSGIQLDWANNTETDLAGYNIYRSDSFGGTYTKINTGLLSSSDFFDTSAPPNMVSYYHVTAVDLSGNESAASTANATRPGADQSPPAAPTGLVPTTSAGGISIDWANNTDTDLAGYNIYRSDSQFGTYVKLNGSLLSSSIFNDTTCPAGVVSWYHVTAVDTSNNESTAAATNAARPADTVKPAQPTNLVLSPSLSGIALDWADNTEIDLLGYNVYRSDSASGTFTKLNTNVITSSAYLDTQAPGGVASFYRVVAVDASSNESDPATGTATRPVPDTIPPAVPAGLTPTVTNSGIALDWADNVEPDLGGYYVYRSTSASGPWTKLTNNPITSSNYLDASAPSGTSYYQVTAVDTTGNESAPATANATRIAAYTATEIGSPTPTGSSQTVTEGSDYNLTAGGADIYGNSDQFGFLYKQVTGDFDIQVRLAALGNSNSFAKAGLMARESLTAGSRNAFILATPGSNGHRFTYRTSTGGLTTSGGSGAVSYPNDWLRLVRSGNTFTGYRSTDGTNWTQVGTVTISGMPSQLFFGMAATSHNTSATTTAQFRNLQNTQQQVNQPPATPTGLTATPSQSGIQLDWADNSDSDLLGYNVYRSSTGAAGSFTKINGSVLTASNFFDSTAPAGSTSYYQVFAVDAANQESATPATVSATRPQPVDTTPPAVPTGLVATPSQSGIALAWNANTDGDLAGYNVYRSDSANGTFVKLNTSGLLTAASFNDTTAPTGVASFYRVTAVDLNANESAFAAANATRPSPQLAGPLKINFQPSTAPTVSGYDVDGGNVFGARSDGFSYGWNVNHSDQVRDRNKTSDQLVDTLVQVHAGASWSINVPNGQYTVKVSVGDSQYATTNTINVNGVNYLSAKALAINTFATASKVITVTNGRIVMDNGASADLTTRVNYIEIAPYFAGTKINFQLAGSPTVAGYQQDNGLAYGDRGNGLTYGWNFDNSATARDRNKNSDQLLDTVVQFRTGSTWAIALPNGTYSVKLSVGDSAYASTYTLNANGQNVFNNVSLAANQFQQKTVTVTVSNGKLTLDQGNNVDMGTRINYIEITQV